MDSVTRYLVEARHKKLTTIELVKVAELLHHRSREIFLSNFNAGIAVEQCLYRTLDSMSEFVHCFEPSLPGLSSRLESMLRTYARLLELQAREIRNLGDVTKVRSGPKQDNATAKLVAAIVHELAAGSNWKRKLDEICEALDESGIPCPKTWGAREPRLRNWSHACALESELAKKAVAYRLKIAKI